MGLRVFPEPVDAAASHGPLARAAEAGTCAGAECTAPDPRVSILMVARNAEVHIDAALHSARRQTFRYIEIVVIDDGSTDATALLVRRHAEQDLRVRLVAGPQKGLAAVRNASLAEARGRYGAILDSDDILHPEHVERLFSLVTRHRAEIVASNMLCFSDTGPRKAHEFMRGEDWSEERLISPARFVEAGRLDGTAPSLGYLKPLFDLRFLRERGLGYDTGLRIGEDYDLVDRALRAGATYVVGPGTTYFYRRHAGSTSHRLTRADLAALLEAERAKDTAASDPSLLAASHFRHRSLERALAHLGAVEAFKRGDWKLALREIARTPILARMLLDSAVEGLSRRLREVGDRLVPARSSKRRKRALVIARPLADKPLRSAIRQLRKEGYDIARMSRPQARRARTELARKGPFDAILVADAQGGRLAPYALSPAAPVIAGGSVDPVPADIVIDSNGDTRSSQALGEAIEEFHRRRAPISAS